MSSFKLKIWLCKKIIKCNFAMIHIARVRFFKYYLSMTKIRWQHSLSWYNTTWLAGLAFPAILCSWKWCNHKEITSNMSVFVLSCEKPITSLYFLQWLQVFCVNVSTFKILHQFSEESVVRAKQSSFMMTS